MNDSDINKLAAKLTKSLAIKDDLKELATKEDLKKLERKIDELDGKADTILEFAEAVDETVSGHEKRLKRIEAVPVIAHQIKK
ncbi:MAG: hypothetical protein AAB414_00045 [Patescibacteria group bacterium]